VADVDCLDDNQVAAYLARRLPPEELSTVVEHLSTCDVCLVVTCAAGSDDAPAPTTIGRYTIIDVIGQGAMGTVYLARDPQLDREVALKVVRADRHAHAGLQSRLAREARAMAQVRHPNVVTVYDAGELDDGVFLAMELVTGETLAAWLAAKPRTWREIIEMFVAAGRGLSAAHAVGIVHRDFKPENVLVDRTGRASVTDFGVAAVRADAALDDAAPTDAASTNDAVTRTGTLLGTPRYMAPEQLRGERADARADQFGFAVALYESLYGAPPFRGATVGELARSITNNVPPAPAGSRAPASVRRALLRALAPDPARRFASIDALVDALLVALRVSGRRARGLIAIGAIAALVGGAAIVVAMWPAREAKPVTAGRTQVLIAPFANTSGLASLDDSLDIATAAVVIASTKLDTLSGVELWAASDGKPPDVTTLAEKRAATADGAIAIVRGRVRRDGPGYIVAIEATLRGRTGTVFSGKRSAATADGLLPATAELGIDLARALGDPAIVPTPALSTSVEAVHAYAQGQLQTLFDRTDDAIASFRRALEHDSELAVARASLGLSLYNAQRKAEAIIELERAFHAAERIPERQRLTLLADYYGVVGRYSEAILAYQQLLAKWPGDGRSLANLTSTAIDANSWPLALEVGRAAVERYGRHEVVRRNLVIAELGNNQFAEVIRDGAALLADMPGSAGAAPTLMSAYALAGRRADAAATIARINAGLAPHATADLAAYEGRLDDAVASLREKPGEVDQMVLAHIYLRRGDRDKAIAAARVGLREDTMPLAYLAASVAIAAGDTTGTFDARARAWIEAPESDRRMFGHLLAGDLARARGNLEAARSAYRAASHIGDSWLVHDRLARGALAANDQVEAERELRWCIDHRGTGALVASPSLFLLPEIYVLYARHAKTRAAYQAVVDLAPAAQADPWTEEARRALR